MASVNMVLGAGQKLGWVQVQCIHNQKYGVRHFALNWPHEITEGCTGPHAVVHLDCSSSRTRVDILDEQGRKGNGLKLRQAIEFMKELTVQGLDTDCPNH